MRITLDLDAELVKEVERQAAETDRTLTEVVDEALREGLRPRETRKPYRLRLPVVKSKLQPGVDLNDRDSLYDLMEDGVWPPS